MTTIPASQALSAGQDWLAANQRALMAEVAAVRAMLGPDAPGPGPEGAQEEISSSLDAVCTCFGLSGFERRIVVLCAAVELDGQFGQVLATAQGDPARAYPTFGLALAAFPGAHWSALAPWAPLRHWQLIEPGPGSLTAAPLRIDEWLLHALAGAGGLDPRLAALVEPLDPADPLPASAGQAVESLTEAWERPGPGVPLLLRGPAGSPKRAVFAAACARLG